MIHLQDDPSALMTMKIGDQAMIDGVSVILEDLGDDVFLTTEDSRVREFNRLNDLAEQTRRERPVYSNYIRHVRLGPVAAMTREQLVQTIRDRTYYIG